MADHPTPDLLLAVADGDRLGADFAAVSEHVANCAECRDVVSDLQRVRTAVRVAHLEQKADGGEHTWPVLAARIDAHRSRRSLRVVSAAGLVAAAVLLTMLAQSVRRSHAPLRQASDSVLLRMAMSQAPVSDETAAATLERTLESWRARLSPVELRAMSGVVDGVEMAIRQTRAELAKDPGNAFLRDHLTELRRKRISALETFIDLARDRG